MSNRKPVFLGLMIAVISLVVGMVIASRLGMSPVSFAGTLEVPKTNSSPLTGPMDAGTFREVAQRASPTVVSIRTTSTREVSSIEEFFGLQNPRNRPRPQQPSPEMAISAGSGFIIDKAGHILTNNHVVDEATKIEVKLAAMDQNETNWLPAKVVGTDLLTDTALLQLTEMPEEPLAVSQFGDSMQLQPGDWVMAIGNPFSLSNTVTVGVVSAVGRQQRTAMPQRFEQMIQTDAAINRGNSGGPLLNIRGEVIGMNTQIYSNDGGGNLGIGFAVPINTIRDILPQLMKGKVVRGRIGVSVLTTPMSKTDAEDLGLSAVSGAVVGEVTDGPAQSAGIRRGDVILEFNGKPVKNSGELVAMVTRTTPGTTVPVKIVRGRKAQTLNVTVAEHDPLAERQQAGETERPQEPEEAKETGFGMTIEPLTPNAVRRMNLPAGIAGALVSDVEATGQAAQAGLRPGDVIVDINDQKVTNVDQASKALDAVASGRNARIVVFRGGREVLVMIRKR
jgi:serine protease Do